MVLGGTIQVVRVIRSAQQPGATLASQIDLIGRRDALSRNIEQGGGKDLREGLGAARYERAMGRTMTRSTTEGADIIDPNIGPVSLKGPLGIDPKTGRSFGITQKMVDGLADSVLKDLKYNTYTKRVVVDTVRMTPAQRSAFTARLGNGLNQFQRGGVLKDIVLLTE